MHNEDYRIPIHAKWLLRHANGCGKPAFYMSQEPHFGLVCAAQKVWFPDGSQPQPGDWFKCGSCGVFLDTDLYVKDLMLEYCEER